jgi:hypothetical protein
MIDIQYQDLQTRCLFTPIWEWEWELVNALPNPKIEALCLVMGICHSGTKSEKIKRLKLTSEVRKFLFNQKVDSLKSLPKKALVENAKKVRVIHYLNKYGIAAALLNWRDECNRKGKGYVKSCLDSIRSKPKQLALF